MQSFSETSMLTLALSTEVDYTCWGTHGVSRLLAEQLRIAGCTVSVNRSATVKGNLSVEGVIAVADHADTLIDTRESAISAAHTMGNVPDQSSPVRGSCKRLWPLG